MFSMLRQDWTFLHLGIKVVFSVVPKKAKPAKPAGRIKLTSNKTRTFYLIVVLLNVSFLRKHEETW